MFDVNFDICKNFNNYFPHNNIESQLKVIKKIKIFNDNEEYTFDPFKRRASKLHLSPKISSRKKSYVKSKKSAIKKIKARFYFKKVINSIFEGFNKFKIKLNFYKRKINNQNVKVERRNTWDGVNFK